MDTNNNKQQSEENWSSNPNRGTGIKFDNLKLRWDLLPLEPIESIIRVLMLGSEKYGDYNWQKVPESRRRYYAAALRHVTSWFFKEKIDPESGESHLAHAATCLIFLMWHEQQEKMKELKEINEKFLSETDDDDIDYDEEDEVEDDEVDEISIESKNKKALIDALKNLEIRGLPEEDIEFAKELAEKAVNKFITGGFIPPRWRW